MAQANIWLVCPLKHTHEVILPIFVGTKSSSILELTEDELNIQERKNKALDIEAKANLVLHQLIVPKCFLQIKEDWTSG